MLEMGSVDRSGTGRAPGQGSETPDVFGQRFREIVTTAIAGVVVGLSAWMLISTFQAAANSASPTALDAFNREKDVMLYGLSLLGTVMGYYFGRVPAELRAKHAEDVAKRTSESLTSATSAAAEAQSEVKRVKSDVRATVAPMVEWEGPAVLGVAPGLGPETSEVSQSAVMHDRLRGLLERLG